jgi:hypothetical protein
MRLHNNSLERTGDAARFGSKVVGFEWVEKMAGGNAPAAQLKAVMQRT